MPYLTHFSKHYRALHILQAIEEIEIRKEKRKKEQAALNRARGGAAAATAAAATAAATVAAATATSAAAAAASTTAILVPLPALPARTTPPPVDVDPSSDSPLLPRNGDKSGENARKPSGNPEGARPETGNTAAQHRAAVSEPLPLPEPSIYRIEGGGEVTASLVAVAAEPATAAEPALHGMMMVDRKTNSATALHKASSTFGLKTTASASRLADQYTPPCPVPQESKKNKKNNKEGVVALGSDSRKRPGTYANMAVEVGMRVYVVTCGRMSDPFWIKTYSREA